MKDNLLTIGYSTLADRLNNISAPEVNLPHDIFISIQNPMNIAYSLPTKFEFRSAISNEKGVAKSRNVVLNNTQTKYLLFADDEIVFLSDGIKSAIAYLESNPNCDLVLAQAVDTKGLLRKAYPKAETKLTRFNSAKAATYEMIVRVETVREKNISFDETFGAGVQNYLGDEYIFIADALRAGLKGLFLPIVIATHPTDSSGSFHNTKQDAIVRSRIFSRVFGVWAPIMRLLFILKPPSKKFGFRNSVSFLIGR